MTLEELEETYDNELEGSPCRELHVSSTVEDLRQGHLQSLAHKITLHRYFEYVFQTLIVANGIVLGIEQDWAVRHIGETVSRTYFSIDIFFTSCFLVELILRIISSGKTFLSLWNEDIRWNLLDLLLVLAAVTEIVLKLFTDTDVFDVATGRLLRLLRLVRAVRVLRVVRFFSDLRIMVLGILVSLKPLGFAIMLLTMIIYIFSICVLQFVLEELERLSGLERGRESPAFKALDAAYGSLAKTSYTLFLSISGGVSWGEACNPLLDISPWLGLYFMLYVAFSVFCVMNIITGIFVEEASAMTAEDDENMLLQELMRRKHFVTEARRFFDEADTDGSGTLTWPEFSERVQHVRMQKVLENLGIDIVACGARNVFESFDFDGNGTIAIGEFTCGLLQLRGPARSIDLAGLRFEQKRLRSDVQSLVKSCSELASQHPRQRAAEAPRPEVHGRPTQYVTQSVKL